MEPIIAVWTDDLMFFSRIEGVARHFATLALMAKTGSQCEAQFSREGFAGLLIDLQIAGTELEKVIKGLPEQANAVGYGSHVDAASLRKAREIGLNPVMPRSQFVERLPKEWLDWFGPRRKQPFLTASDFPQ